MWSFDLHRVAAGFAWTAAFAVSATTGGCTSVQPLYGSVTGQPSPVVAQLHQVEVEVAKSRLSQEIRNELIYQLYGGEGSPDPKPKYKLSVRVNDSNVPVGIEKFEDLPAAYLEQLNATFTLTETATDKTLLTGTSFENAAYDFSNQRYANIRAQRDAQNRAGTVIADDIQIKLAAYFADHH
jgi:LPS-assembly lipoprotein